MLSVQTCIGGTNNDYRELIISNACGRIALNKEQVDFLFVSICRSSGIYLVFLHDLSAQYSNFAVQKTRPMDKSLILFLFVLVGSLIACQSEKGAPREVQEIPVDGTNASIIRNPVTINGPVDTINVAKMEFEEETYNFGAVKAGDVVTHTFHFTNVGKVPLIINHAKSTCGCTVPEWPRAPIAPGEKGKIEVKFNTKNKGLRQKKPVTITANTYPANTKIFLEGYVEPEGQVTTE